MNFKSRLAHLEGCLTRSQDAVEDKNNVIQRLEKRLDEMEDSRRNEDGERRERDGRFHKMDAHIKVGSLQKVLLKNLLLSRNEQDTSHKLYMLFWFSYSLHWRLSRLKKYIYNKNRVNFM